MFKHLNKRKLIAFVSILVICVALFLKGARSGTQSTSNPQASTQIEGAASVVQAQPRTVPSTNETTATEKNTPPQLDNVVAQNQVQILNEILASHNDNDPRLDHELRNLGPEAKKQFRSLYHNLPQESRNDRGTIVFLLGRNLTDNADFEFLKDVLGEVACLSLIDCKMSQALFASTDEDGGQSEVALNYPQAVVLESIDRVLTSQQPLNTQTHAYLESVLKSGAHSASPFVAHGSQNLLKKL